jgi:squalene-hopene/tetraprenyl-beta-curcumene cyclase
MIAWRCLELEGGLGRRVSFARSCPLLAVLLMVVALGSVASPPQAKDGIRRKSESRSPDEPLAGSLSFARAERFLDGETLTWLEERKCASCHTGYPYLLARSGIPGVEAPAARRVRAFFEDRVVAWDCGGKGAGYLKGGGSLKVSEGVTEVVAVAATLALHDAQTTGKLHPLTRRALDRMWELQQRDGSWPWNKTGLAPMECDDAFGAIYAALGVGHAPDAYAGSDAAREGLVRLQRFLRKAPPPTLHHRTWLLWASVPLEGLMAPAERAQAIQALLDRQRDDGGWSLHSLGDWKRVGARAGDRPAESDGYATGLVLYVLRQAGIPAEQEAMRRGADWLKAHQRASGCWFTRSMCAGGHHHITNAGTAFALMALRACDVAGK